MKDIYYHKKQKHYDTIYYMNSIMEKQEFIEKYNFVKESVISAMDKALERALENEVIDPSKCDGNYLDVYPLIGAVLKRELSVLLLTVVL